MTRRVGRSLEGGVRELGIMREEDFSGLGGKCGWDGVCWRKQMEMNQEKCQNLDG